VLYIIILSHSPNVFLYEIDGSPIILYTAPPRFATCVVAMNTNSKRVLG